MAPLNQCCCGCSLKTGTIIIAVVYMILNFLHIAKTATEFYQYQYAADSKNEDSDIMTAFIIALVFSSIDTTCDILLLFGAIKETAGLLIPWIISQILVLILLFVASIIYIAAAGGSTYGLLGTALICVIISVTSYFLRVVLSYYKTLRENPPYKKCIEDREGCA